MHGTGYWERRNSETIHVRLSTETIRKEQDAATAVLALFVHHFPSNLRLSCFCMLVCDFTINSLYCSFSFVESWRFSFPYCWSLLFHSYSLVTSRSSEYTISQEKDDIVIIENCCPLGPLWYLYEVVYKQTYVCTAHLLIRCISQWLEGSSSLCSLQLLHTGIIHDPPLSLTSWTAQLYLISLTYGKTHRFTKISVLLRHLKLLYLRQFPPPNNSILYVADETFAVKKSHYIRIRMYVCRYVISYLSLKGYSHAEAAETDHCYSMSLHTSLWS